ncbi:MAG: hypothetical protein ACYTFY_18435, partial [Planctomycetota bacterium]
MEKIEKMDNKEFEKVECLECKKSIKVRDGRYSLSSGSLCIKCFSRSAFFKHSENGETESAHYENG